MMKHDWDDRARQDAKWFINTLRFQQSEEEFDQTGYFEVKRLVLAELPLLTAGRDPKTLRLLEIGCGCGRMLRHLAEIFGEVVGVDVSGEMIRQARERLSGVGNVQLYETSGVDFSDLPDEHFDLILSAYVFQHVPSAAVIQSNLDEAWRVLKRGGVFKFQTNSITAFDFEEIEKDTWTGASFPESELRRFAAEKDAQLISIAGAETQYCWTTLRKRTRPPFQPGDKLEFTMAEPAIIDFGRADDFQIKRIPNSGDQAWLGLIISGLQLDEIDANSLIVEINGERVMPQYAGPIDPKLDNYGLKNLTQVNQKLPRGLPESEVEVKALTIGGDVTPPIRVELYDLPPIIPRIVNVRNSRDEQVEMLSRGQDAELWLFVEGLDLTADPGNTRVKIGERIIKPASIIYQPANAAYLVKTLLPAKLASGLQDIKIFFGNLESAGWSIQIR